MDGPSFDFTRHIHRVCEHMTGSLPALAHIDMSRVAVSVCQTRKPVSHGIFASLTPLRFAGGQATTIRRGRPHMVEPVCDPSGRQMLYILSIYLPRFQNLDLREKLITMLHELWHICPRFSGDIRRHTGRYHAHTHSQAQYDEEMGRLADQWLATKPPDELWSFLNNDFCSLAARHGRIVGMRIRRPRIVPIANHALAAP